MYRVWFSCLGGRGSTHTLLLTLMYRLEIWAWNRAQQSRVHAVEMSYLRGALDVTRWKSETNESMCEQCDMGTFAN